MYAIKNPLLFYIDSLLHIYIGDYKNFERFVYMMDRGMDFKHKEVINIKDGKRLYVPENYLVDEKKHISKRKLETLISDFIKSSEIGKTKKTNDSICS